MTEEHKVSSFDFFLARRSEVLFIKRTFPTLVDASPVSPKGLGFRVLGLSGEGFQWL